MNFRHPGKQGMGVTNGAAIVLLKNVAFITQPTEEELWPTVTTRV
jgi:hypothetical protein